MFVTSWIGAAIHLGQDFLENSEIYKNTKFENIENVFSITQKLIEEHSEEILNGKTLHYHSPSWTRSTLFNDNVIKWAKAKVCVYADSVLCVGKKEQHPGAADAKWTGQTEDSNGTPRTKTQWVLMEKQLNSSGKNFPRFTRRPTST